MSPKKVPFRIALVYLVGAILAELATVLISASIGFISYSCLLIILLFHAAREAPSALYGLLQGLAVVTLVRLVTLTSPPANFPPDIWLLIVLISIFLMALALVRMLRLSRQQIGLVPKKPAVQLLVALTGLVFGYLHFLALETGSSRQIMPLGGITPVGFLIFVSAAILSEYLFRGVLQRLVSPALKSWSVVYLSILYTVLHISYGSLPYMGVVLIMSLMYAWVRQKTGSVVGTALSHIVANATVFVCIATGFRPV